MCGSTRGSLRAVRQNCGNGAEVERGLAWLGVGRRCVVLSGWLLPRVAVLRSGTKKARH
jgi:hypothetical protein